MELFSTFATARIKKANDNSQNWWSPVWVLANNVKARYAAASSRLPAIFATSSGIQRAAKGAIPALKQTMARIDVWRKSNREVCAFVTGWSRLGALIAVYPPLHKPYGMTYLT